MNERIVRMDRILGHVAVISLERAVSELSGNDLFFSIAERLRSGETVRRPGGVVYRAASALTEHSFDVLPADVAS